jgi:hypothetical protein
MALEFILQENTLTDNVLLLPTKGKIFKGNYIAIIKEYCFQNAWSDREIMKKFRSKNQLLKYIEKKYPKVDYLDFNGTTLED